MQCIKLIKLNFLQMQVQARVFPAMHASVHVINFFPMLMMTKRMVKNLTIQKT